MTRLAAILASAALAGPAAAQSLDVSIMVGGDPDHGTCGRIGAIETLDPKGDGVLAVRAGPSIRYDKLDEVDGDDNVFLCDRSGRWWGVVYGAQCGVAAPIADRAPYSGPCRAGWIYDRYADFNAG